MDIVSVAFSPSREIKDMLTGSILPMCLLLLDSARMPVSHLFTYLTHHT